MASRIVTALKALVELGPEPLVLNLIYRAGLVSGYYKRSEIGGSEISQGKRGRLLEKLFELPEREVLKVVMGEEGANALLEQAEEIVGGKVRIFGAAPEALHFSVPFPLKHWTEYERHPEQLFSPHAPVTDIKFLWEPARFGWVYTLGRAFHLAQEDRYAETFWKYFENFIQNNPPYLGPHWMNGQEVAIRLMALVWAGHVFAAAPCSTAERRASLTQAVAQHAARIPPTLIYARSQNNNHLVTEAAGLYTAGLALKDEAWRCSGWRWLNWCFQHQVSGYGEYIQHSTNYHRLMLQTALWIDLIKQEPWPHASRQALERAAHFLFSILDTASGQVPNLGANDGALILPLSSLPFEDFRPVVQAAARAFLDAQISPGPWDETSLWLGIGPAHKIYEPGHYLGDNLHGRESWAYLRASRFKSRLGHMDQLHLDLWWRGLNIAQDAGTYLYNAAPPWDNPLVSTRVHNTVTVDGRDQMTRGGRFLTLDWFPAYSKSVVEGDPQVLQRMIAWHTGYRGVRHERQVTVYAGDRWVIEDRLASSSLHTYRLHWLLPDWEWKLETSHPEIVFSLSSPHGPVLITVNAAPLFSSPPVSSHPSTDPLITAPLFSLARAGELLSGKREAAPYDGWISPTYGIRLPALSLAMETLSVETIKFTTEFIFPS